MDGAAGLVREPQLVTPAANVLALLLGATLGWASGALKAHLHSLRRPQAFLRAGGECRLDLPVLPAPVRPPGDPGTQDRQGTLWS